jgi:hypothetical protein
VRCWDVAGAEGVGISVGRYGKEGYSGGLIDMAADVRVGGENPTKSDRPYGPDASMRAVGAVVCGLGLSSSHQAAN